MRKVEDIRTDIKRLYEHLEAGGDGCTFDICGLVKETEEALNKLAEYENLEEQGRLIRLPCKVGDVVYTIEKRRNNHGTHDKVIVEHTVIAFVIEGCPVPFMQIVGDNANKNIYGKFVRIDAIGTLAYLTRAEAEAKLKEIEESEKK